MKKVILLLILILPVMIVFLCFSIAGFVGRTIMYAEITDVYISDHNWEGFIDAGYRERRNMFVIETTVGGVYELEKFFTVQPSRAKFSDLEFEYSNPSAVTVTNGKIHVQENMRTSDYIKEGGVIVTATYGEKAFFSVCVEILVDQTRFDYLGFDHNIFAQGLSNLPFCDLINGQLVIRRQELEGSTISDFGSLLRGGIDIAPYNLLYNNNPNRVEFLNTFEFSSLNRDVLALSNQGVDSQGINQISASILNEGSVDIKISAVFNNIKLETVINIQIV